MAGSPSFFHTIARTVPAINTSESTPTHLLWAKPMSESTLTLCHRRLYPSVRVFGFGLWVLGLKHKSTYIYRVPQCTVCLLVGIGTPTPLSRKRVCPPPPNNSLLVRGGRVPIPTTGERLSTLPTLLSIQKKAVIFHSNLFQFLAY